MRLFSQLSLVAFACALGVTAHASAGQKGVPQEPDVCALLTSDDVKGVQGEAVTATKPSRSPNPQFVLAQCFYTLRSSSKGISLALSVPAADRPAAAREFWQERFHRERERSRKARAAAGREAKDDAVPVKGVGDEAFWVGDDRIGSLYVLAGQRFFRISVGGVTDPGERRKRSLQLARLVLKRLSAAS